MSKRLLGIALIFISFIAPYFGSESRIRFAAGTLGILVGIALIFGRKWRNHSGLKFSSADLAFASLLAIMTYFFAAYTIPEIVHRSSRELVFHVSRGWTIRPFQFFQVLNEEIVLRALLLLGLSRVMKGRALISALLAAAVFSILHYCLYRFDIDPAQRESLGLITLANLFLFGLICNWSYYVFGNVTYSLALHTGWNLFRLSGDIRNWQMHANLSEPQSFNTIEGSTYLTGFIFLSTLTLLIIAKMQRKSLMIQ